MLDGLFVTPAVTAIVEALQSARASGSIDSPHRSAVLRAPAEPGLAIAVVGHAKLAAALAKTHTVVPVAMPRRAKLAGAVADLSAVEPGSLAAVVGVDVTIDDSWESTLRGWSRVVRDGGALVLVDRGRSPEASRRALCAGLAELEQRRAGRAVVTSGLVTQL